MPIDLATTAVVHQTDLSDRTLARKRGGAAFGGPVDQKRKKEFGTCLVEFVPPSPHQATRSARMVNWQAGQ
jgi:hypothetical protein